MGSTVITNKFAAAFKAPDNRVVYVLFEEGYEKNCYPHTPRWCCRYIGHLEGAIKRIFDDAATCESGILQNRNGKITPEGYIAGWMKLMKAPAELPDRQLSLEVGAGLYSPVPECALDDVESALNSIGRQDIAQALRAGEKYPIMLHADVAVVMALYGPTGFLSPWRILDRLPATNDHNAILGYNPAPAKQFEVFRPVAMRADENSYLLKFSDKTGRWFCAGWQYSIVGQYIRRLWEAELREPGSYRKRIKAYRDAFVGVPKIPQGVKVEIDMRVPMSAYQRDCVDKFIQEHPVTATARGYEAMVTDENLYQATHLPEECTTWLVPEQAAAPVDQPTQQAA